MLFRISLIVLGLLAGTAIAGWLRLREERQTWGVEPEDTERALAGDDLIDDPGIVETRSLRVDAPPSVVWPWLVQMGYGRGGWYSYDRMDMKGSSAREILPEFQDLKVDDLVPTDSGGGFVAKIVEPDKALVLYLDTELVNGPASTPAEGEEPEAADVDEAVPGGLAVAGAMGEMSMPEFKGTWAFILEPEEGDKTRLVERFRLRTVDAGMPQKLGMPIMGYGVFAMTRKHMLGVKERAEARGSNWSSAASTGADETMLAQASPNAAEPLVPVEA
jgi:hypothetical protein